MDPLRLPEHVISPEPFGLSSAPDERPAMLDFRGHNGTSFALPYRHLVSATHIPAEGMTLEFRDHRILVRGRNLQPVYEHLLGNRVVFLQEQDFDANPEWATFIDAIVVERLESAT